MASPVRSRVKGLEPLAEEEPLLARRVVLEDGEHLVAELLVERPRLIAEGVQMGLRAAALPSDALDPRNQSATHSLAPQLRRDPDQRDVKPVPVHRAIDS